MPILRINFILLHEKYFVGAVRCSMSDILAVFVTHGRLLGFGISECILMTVLLLAELSKTQFSGLFIQLSSTLNVVSSVSKYRPRMRK